MQYIGLCVFNLPIFLMMIMRICVLYFIIIIKSEAWTNSHCLGLSNETMIYAVCLDFFLWRHHRVQCESRSEDVTKKIVNTFGINSKCHIWSRVHLASIRKRIHWKITWATHCVFLADIAAFWNKFVENLFLTKINLQNEELSLWQLWRHWWPRRSS